MKAAEQRAEWILGLIKSVKTPMNWCDIWWKCYDATDRWMWSLDSQIISRALTALRKAGFIEPIDVKTKTDDGVATAYVWTGEEWNLDRFRSPAEPTYCRHCGSPLWRDR